MTKPTVIERAYQLAETDGFSSINTIKKRLHAEGFSHGEIHGQLYGRTIRLTLRRLCAGTAKGLDRDAVSSPAEAQSELS